MKYYRQLNNWFRRKTTDQKIAIIGLIIAVTGSIFIPVTSYIFSPSAKPANNTSGNNSPIINQAPNSRSEISFNTSTNIIKGTDPRDIENYLKKLKSKTKEDRYKEIDALYTSKEIDSSLKDTLYTVIEYIDQNLKESSQDINAYRQEGRASLASSLEQLNNALAGNDTAGLKNIAESQSSASPADQAILYINAGSKLTALLKYDEAGTNFNKALNILKNAGLTATSDYALALNSLGNLYFLQGKYDLALSCFRQSLDIRKKITGTNNPAYASDLNNLGVVYYKKGDYISSEPLLKEALELRKKILGPNHPDYAQSLYRLAGLYRDQYKYDLAEPMYKEALNIYKKTYGPDSPDYAIALNNLALFYDDQGRYDLAEPLYIESLKIIKSSLGTNHPATIDIQRNYDEFQMAK